MRAVACSILHMLANVREVIHPAWPGYLLADTRATLPDPAAVDRVARHMAHTAARSSQGSTGSVRSNSVSISRSQTGGDNRMSIIGLNEQSMLGGDTEMQMHGGIDGDARGAVRKSPAPTSARVMRASPLPASKSASGTVTVQGSGSQPSMLAAPAQGLVQGQVQGHSPMLPRSITLTQPSSARGPAIRRVSSSIPLSARSEQQPQQQQQQTGRRPSAGSVELAPIVQRQQQQRPYTHAPQQSGAFRTAAAAANLQSSSAEGPSFGLDIQQFSSLYPPQSGDSAGAYASPADGDQDYDAAGANAPNAPVDAVSIRDHPLSEHLALVMGPQAGPNAPHTLNHAEKQPDGDDDE